MKKLFIFGSALMLTIILSAQTESGTFYLSLGNGYTPLNQSNWIFGEGFNFGSEWVTGITVDGDDDDDHGNDYWDDDEKDRTNNFNLSGQFGHFVSDGFLAGVGVDYGSVTMTSYEEDDMDMDGFDDERTSEDKYTSLAFSPFVKYYIPQDENALFVSASYTFGTLNNESSTEIEYSGSQSDYENDNESEPMKTSRWSFGAGMAFFLSENISLEPSINYALNTYTQETEEHVGNTGYPNYIPIYDDEDRETKTSAFYFKIAASFYL